MNYNRTGNKKLNRQTLILITFGVVMEVIGILGFWGGLNNYLLY